MWLRFSAIFLFLFLALQLPAQSDISQLLDQASDELTNLESNIVSLQKLTTDLQNDLLIERELLSKQNKSLQAQELQLQSLEKSLTCSRITIGAVLLVSLIELIYFSAGGQFSFVTIQ